MIGRCRKQVVTGQVFPGLTRACVLYPGRLDLLPEARRYPEPAEEGCPQMA